MLPSRGAVKKVALSSDLFDWEVVAGSIGIVFHCQFTSPSRLANAAPPPLQ